MATRGAIGLRNEDGTITGIYSHWDSYVSHNGRILFEDYDHTKTRELLSLGSVSSLRKEIGKQHDFNKNYNHEDPRYHWCKFYTRDRGDELQAAETFATEDEFVNHFKDVFSEYFYLLEECGTWFVKSYSGSWERVDRAIKEAKENE
jgi:hypothetical protein